MAATNWLPKPINGDDDNGMEAPLKAIDIRDTLAYYGNGIVTNDTKTFFSKENINRWSQHKPIVVGRQAEYVRFIQYKDDIWKNQPGQAPTIYIGIDSKDQEKLELVWNGATEDDWFPYTPPKGGEDQPLRLGDFRGYRADATSPFKSFSCDSTEIEPINGTATFYLNMRYYLVDPLDQKEGGMLSLQDLQVFDDKHDYYMVLISKYNDIYDVHVGSNWKEASWGELVSTIELGKINSLNEGTYTFAAALMDDTGTYYRLPFNKISLEAKIYYANSYRGPVTGKAEYYLSDDVNSDTGSSNIEVSCDYTLGWETDGGQPVTGPKNITIQFYIGATAEDAKGPIFLGPSVTKEVKPGETVTFSVKVNAENYYPFNSQILPILQSCADEGVIYVGADGEEGDKINLSIY